MHGVRYMARSDLSRLAWSLIELTRPNLPRRERISLVTMIGAGDIEIAVMDLVDYCTEIGVEVPDDLIEPLADWVGGYRGTAMEGTLRDRIGALLSNKYADEHAGPMAPTTLRCHRSASEKHVRLPYRTLPCA